MNNKNKNQYLSIGIVFAIIWSLILYAMFFLTLSPTSVKYSHDYSVTDLLKAQKIVLEIEEPTEKSYKKYDINEDREITSTDVNLIEQMILGYFDSYEVRTYTNKVIDYKD